MRVKEGVGGHLRPLHPYPSFSVSPFSLFPLFYLPLPSISLPLAATPGPSSSFNGARGGNCGVLLESIEL